MTYESIQLAIPNQKKLKLATEIFKPMGSGPFPIVLLFHGFTGYKEDPGLIDIAEKLAEKGIVSVRFTSSGFGDSEGTLEDDHRFSNYRNDAHVVYEYVRNLPYIDGSRTGVYGHSMGGKLAVLFCQDHPLVSVLVAASAPVIFSGTAYGSLLTTWKQNGYFEKVSGRDGGIIRVPYAYAVDVDRPVHDVLKAADSVRTPHALVVVGDADEEVPWQETEKIYKALRCPKEFVKLSGIPHKYSHESRLIPLVNVPITQFFVKYV